MRISRTSRHYQYWAQVYCKEGQLERATLCQYFWQVCWAIVRVKISGAARWVIQKARGLWNAVFLPIGFTILAIFAVVLDLPWGLLFGYYPTKRYFRVSDWDTNILEQYARRGCQEMPLPRVFGLRLRPIAVLIGVGLVCVAWIALGDYRRFGFIKVIAVVLSHSDQIHFATLLVTIAILYIAAIVALVVAMVIFFAFLFFYSQYEERFALFPLLKKYLSSIRRGLCPIIQFVDGE